DAFADGAGARRAIADARRVLVLVEHAVAALRDEAVHVAADARARRSERAAARSLADEHRRAPVDDDAGARVGRLEEPADRAADVAERRDEGGPRQREANVWADRRQQRAPEGEPHPSDRPPRPQAGRAARDEQPPALEDRGDAPPRRSGDDQETDPDAGGDAH